MHLKSLVLKGFKSFAQPTTFAFEPGVTCIVGPNGSGKSNVVDALSWVMGEQGAKNLRGASMADVIFAGTSTRGPLGRAEVVLTIDNADGALPIEYGEVAISRTLFRDGRSEYAINGDAVRLLDVQELLSDSGLGREMHVIVGQGQLDAVLRATPQERRGFIEEAAGVLKHRRRRERTLRKLEAMQANLARLTDLAEELRRQLKPLGAQAEIAREAAGVQAAVREAKTRLLAHDAARLAGALAQLRQQQEAAETGRHLSADALQLLTVRVEVLERDGPAGPLDDARRAAVQLEGVQQRFRDLARNAATRVAMLAPELVAAPADTGAAERAAAAGTIADLQRREALAGPAQQRAQVELEQARRALEQVDRAVGQATAEAARHDRAVAAARTQADAAASSARAAGADLARRRAGAEAAGHRLAAAEQAVTALPPGDVDEQEEASEDGAVARADARSQRAAAELHRLEREQSAAAARLDALRSATVVPAGTAQVLAALPGARRLQDVLDVDPDWRTAVAAVLGVLVDAAVLPDPQALPAAARAVAPLGAVDVVAASGPAPGPAPMPTATSGSGTPAVAVVRAPAGVLALLAGVVLVDDLPQAQDAVAAGATTAVTRSGELATASRLRTAGSAVSGVELAADRDAAEADAQRLAAEVARARQAASAAAAARRAAVDERDAALVVARERARASRRAAEQRAGLRARAEAARAEGARADQQAEEADAVSQAADAVLTAARQRAAGVAAEPRPPVDLAARGPAAARVEAAREAALTARLEAETLRERLRAETARADALQRRAAEAERQVVAAARRAAERTMQREAAEQVLAALPAWQASVDRSAAEAGIRLAQLEQQRQAQDAELRDARTRLAVLRAEASQLDHRVRDLDMHAYEQQVSLGAVRDRAMTELGLDDRALAAEAVEGLDRAEQERLLAAAERRLGRLGRVNPLALEEFAALEQRHRFLTDQLADLHRTRADLLQIVQDLDQRMRRIFEAAFADTEAAFAQVFPVLFPGGTGRLSLTDDGDEPGIEVSVRPAGKRIERLSLLSGGERSLAAVAFLLAIFTARPSPFYILDEVEAALDDANLGRLLEVVSSLRDSSQLILITHQKRTMEIADALYGVSMRQDGVSAVVGQRLAARADAG